MKILLHDLSENEFSQFFEQLDKQIKVIDTTSPAAFCKGCYGCWLKTPGECVMRDRYQTIGSCLLQSDELIIVSKCVYGGYSVPIKKLIDRSIPGVLPFFVKKNGELHHAARYNNKINLKVYFYSENTEKEKSLAKRLVEANGLNFWAEQTSVTFLPLEKLSEVICK